jgi:PrtD family type I secretion system ABC transporter
MIVFLRKCSIYFFYSWIFSLFINTLHLTFSIYMLVVYDDVLASSSFPTLYVVTALAISALAAWSLLEFCRSRLLVRAGIKLDTLLSRTVLKEMLQELSQADSIHYTDGLRDIVTLRNYLGGNAIFAFFDVPWIFIYLGIIFLVHPVLGLTATFGAVVVFIIGILQGRLTCGDMLEAKRQKSLGQNWCMTSFRTARELQTMGMISGAAEGYCARNDQEMLFHDRMSNISHILGSVSQSFGPLMQVLIFGVGAALVLRNESGAGVIIAASIIMGQALAPIRNGMDAWRQTSGAKTAYDNLNRLLQTGMSRKHQTSFPPILGKLQVRQVNLNIGKKAVLQAIDFTLSPGEIMGLIGPNGAGKTSLCRLILGIWKPTVGTVLLDGMDMFELDNDVLGPFIGYLPQNVELFTGTVTENIARLGPIDPQEVVTASKNAGAHETILRFAQGYDTDIGEAGLSLSGGQRQRIGLARALYGNPKLVILDEPNSNLDEAGEQALTKALHGLKLRGTTTIMITHKINLLTEADKILVLQHGEQILFGDRNDVLQQLAGATPCKG